MLTQILFEALRSALWGIPFNRQISAEEFLNVMAVAEQQTVTALVFDTLSRQKVGIEKKVVLNYTNKLSRIHRKNQLFNATLQEFARRCEQHHISYIVMKGQTVGGLYPVPTLRIPGDIDFLIKDEYETCKRQIELAFGVKLPQVIMEKEISYTWNNVLFELHDTLLVFGSKKNMDYWRQLTDEAWEESCHVMIDNTRVRTLPPTLNAVYLFLHLFFHLIREGVALRQLCDWAVFLKAYSNDIDRRKLAQIIEQLDIEKAFLAFGYILINDLGLAPAAFPLKVSQEDAAWRTKILSDIFKGGNFGKKNHHTKNSLLFKLETTKIAIKNSFRYHALAPTETKMLIPRLLRRNIQLIKTGRLR